MTKDVALIVGGGPGISASCARLFARSGMHVGIAARTPDKPALQNLEQTHGVRRYACDASKPEAVALLFQDVVRDLGVPTLVVHNIDGRVPGIFRKGIAEADASLAFETLRNSAFSVFLVGQQAARLMRENRPDANGTKGTIIFTNASAALKGFASSGAFAMACQAKSGLAQSMARELMPQGIHIACTASAFARALSPAPSARLTADDTPPPIAPPDSINCSITIGNTSAIPASEATPSWPT